jgi:hypothetical protein
MRCSRRQRDNGGQLIVVDPSARLRRGWHYQAGSALVGAGSDAGQQPTNVDSEDSCKGRLAEAADFSVTPYLTPRIKESAYTTTTTLGHEKGPVKATITDLTVADGASKEDQFCWPVRQAETLP